MLQRDCFGQHKSITTKASKALGRACRRLRRVSPFQLDLFIPRIPLGIAALKRLLSGAVLRTPTTALRVVFKFAQGGSFFFTFDHQLFSLPATDAALLEI
jgi:hypothetical protein